ncbi:hypothetical protein BU26DRAFT_170023 [Trematosphaeria pertusa]|uniref:Uncharacterized protein n=1 Tax=Trematosphaeria pertusa TaxID=390896 RepID=A0A6A6HVH5_9PLEO|nr:uncharacterized protein BU26DRAFT_170023 [Trematosphaeria pertusa]KAF2241768.1 hypothetical protein BU26DRAFT_170023 [Trematosphaeria pertusa]
MSPNARRAVPAAVALLLLVLFWHNHGARHSPYPLVPLDGNDAVGTNGKPPFYPGIAKPPGSNYTRILVVPKTKDEDISWIQIELPELQTAIYEVDKPDAKLQIPKNKGHEAMVYLSFIIDHYDSLPDTIIFVHAHKGAWHNNILLDLDTPTTIKRLRDDRVARQGYMNLRCHHDPGCPDWIHLDRAKVDFDERIKPEEKQFSFELFQEMFPGHRPPPVLSQACCAQLAVSRERVRDNPKALYEHLRSWLLATRLEDKDSGRVFEYMWQYLFTRNAEHCPSINACYCDGYGICFGSAANLDAWLKKLRKRELADEEYDRAKKEGKDLTTMEEINSRRKTLNRELNQEKVEAYKKGDDEMNRALERERLPEYTYT